VAYLKSSTFSGSPNATRTIAMGNPYKSEFFTPRSGRFFLLAAALALAATSSFFFSPKRADPAATLVFPPSRSTLVRTPSTTLTARYDTIRIQDILLLRPFMANRSLMIDQPQRKMGFARELYKMIPRNVFLSTVIMKSNRDSLRFRFPLEKQVDLKKFWESTELQQIWSSVHHRKSTSADIAIAGWTASSFHSTQEIRRTSRDYFSLSVALDPGLNEFQLMLLDSAQSVIMIDSLKVYYSIPTSFEDPPDGFEVSVFHSSQSEEQCVSCHEDISSDCGTCHRGLADLPSVHPVAEDCSLCHDLSSTVESKLIEGQEFNQDLCFTCHDDKRELLETKPVVHGTATECLMCHNPHGSTFDTMVRDRTTKICMMCHEEKAKQSHPVAGHPMEGPKDPHRPGKKLTCTSCHNPHASDHSKLFRFPTLPICSYCHAKG